jgi:hypothetical protein
MKTTLQTLAIAGACSALVSSQAITNAFNNTPANSPIEIAPISAKAFVKKKDGTVEYYQTLKLVKGVFKAPHLLADGKTKIEAKDIIAYQNDQHFAISQETFAGGKKSFVAVETLPGFAIRISKGKMNVYCKKFYNGRAAVDEFYLQLGDEGSILPYSADLMTSMISNNNEALSYFSANPEEMLTKKIQIVADLYNNSALITKN